MATNTKVISRKISPKMAKKRINFNLNAPEAKEVILAGSFNE